MIAVLHLFDGSIDVEDRQTLEILICDTAPDVNATAVGIGPGGEARDAISAAGGIRRRAPDVVHAWGKSALRAALIGGARAIVYSPAGPPASRRILHLIGQWCNLHVVDRADRAPILQRSSVILPAVEPRVRTDTAVARRAVGLADDDIAILAVGESTRAADHPSAVWAAGILNVLDPRYKIVLWGRGPFSGSAVMLADKMRQRAMVTVAPAGTSWETLVDSADLALCTASGPVATWSIAVCMAAGLPIVSTIHRTTYGFLTDRTARLATDPSPRTLARCVLDVREDSASAAARAAGAAHIAREVFSVERLRSDYAKLYRRMLTNVTTAPAGEFTRSAQSVDRSQSKARRLLANL